MVRICVPPAKSHVPTDLEGLASAWRSLPVGAPLAGNNEQLGLQRAFSGELSASEVRGTNNSNPTLCSFSLSKNTRYSGILGDQINAFCPRFCPQRKAIKDPGWCGLDAPRQQFIHRGANLAAATDAGQRLRKPCRNPGHLRYPRLHPACSQAARQGRARAPQSTMTKVGKSHRKGTFAGAFGNDGDARIPDFRAPRPAARKFNPGLPFAFRVTSTPIRIKR